MSDEVDIANEMQETYLKFEIANRKPVKIPLLKNWHCHNCNEMLDQDVYFCDEYCIEDFKKSYFRKHGKLPDWLN